MKKKEDIIVGRRLKSSYVSTVFSISLVLFVLGILGLVIINASRISDHVKENISITVEIEGFAPPPDAKDLEKTLSGMAGVNSTEFIPSEVAADQLKDDLGEDFVAFLGYNPLNPVIEVRLTSEYANVDSLKVFKEKLMNNRIVKDVDYPDNLVQLVNENIRKLGVVLLFITSLLLLVAYALISNTIRLSIFSKRFLIRSMQLVGATRSFISKPFLLKGIMQGLIGAAVAIILLIATLYYARQHVPGLLVSGGEDMLLILFGILIITGIIISWISTYFAVRKYLRIKTEYLYLY